MSFRHKIHFLCLNINIQEVEICVLKVLKMSSYRMKTMCLSTECSSSQQLLNEIITGHRKTENTTCLKPTVTLAIGEPLGLLRKAVPI